MRKTVPSFALFHYSRTFARVSCYLQHVGVSLAELNQEGLQQFRVLLDHLANLLELRLISQEGEAIGTISCSTSCSSSLGRTTSVSSGLGSGSEKVLWLGSSGSGESSAGSGRGRGSSRAGRCSSTSSSRCAGCSGGRCACVSLEMIRDTLQNA